RRIGCRIHPRSARWDKTTAGGRSKLGQTRRDALIPCPRSTAPRPGSATGRTSKCTWRWGSAAGCEATVAVTRGRHHPAEAGAGKRDGSRRSATLASARIDSSARRLVVNVIHLVLQGRNKLAAAGSTCRSRWRRWLLFAAPDKIGNIITNAMDWLS